MDAAHFYTVTAERDGRWWVFEFPELGTGGQARSLAEVESEARAIAAAWQHLEPEQVAVAVKVRAPADVLAQWASAEQEERAARQAQARSAERRRAVVRHLRENRYSAADIGRILGISKQRVYQLEKSTAATAAPAPRE